VRGAFGAGHAAPLTRTWLSAGRRTRDADARLGPRSAPGPPSSPAPLRGRAVSRRVREDESDATAFAASTLVRVNWLDLLVCDQIKHCQNRPPSFTAV